MAEEFSDYTLPAPELPSAARGFKKQKKTKSKKARSTAVILISISYKTFLEEDRDRKLDNELRKIARKNKYALTNLNSEILKERLEK